MPRQTVPQIENTFTGGLITEATALNFPANAVVDADNCVFHPKGDVYRRYGLDYEVGYASKTVSRTGNAMSTYTWVNPAGQDKTFLVVQIGRYLYFYAVADAAVSAGAHATAIDMDAYKTDTATLLALNECQFASGQGYLFVAHPFCKPFYVAYTPGSGALAATGIDVKVRDTDGIVDETGYVYDDRPSTLTDKHRYNLLNQGWFPTNTVDYIAAWRTPVYHGVIVPDGSGGYFPVSVLDSPGNTNYPSNSDVWWMCQRYDGVFLPNLADVNKRGGSPAPKGFFVLDAWNMDRIDAVSKMTTTTGSGGWRTNSVVTGAITLTGVPATTSGTARPSAVAFHAGRVFYAGTNAQNYSNKIFFTQVIKTEEQFGRCHQLNDPTNDKLFDLLATDGGVVTIPEMGRVLKLFSTQSLLIVFATNGVWVIAGNENIGFSAGDYSVRRVSAIPAIAAQSFVDVDGLPCWWNYDGVYMVTEVNNAGGLKIESLTDQTIRTYYKEEIPTSAKPYAVGVYNQLTREIRWLWRSASVSSFEQNYEYDRALTFNMLTKGFSPWSFDKTLARVCGVTALKTRGTSRQEVNGVMTDVTSFQGSVFKYLISNTGGTSLTFGETKNAAFRDFYGVNSVGVDYESFFLTGYQEDAGSPARRRQANYIVLFVRNQDNPEFSIRGVYDFGGSEASGRWGVNQLIQFPEVGAYDYRMKKVKVMGTGRSVQFRVASSAGKPFDISGWARWQTVNAGI